ncbi:MAG TPA: hypothetical protein DCY79_18465 [Planctomycetaceae bacterium]|nr:hypothetical protein [Blastopirellula sp.]HAY81793.1 hypothetical protein [Planctomycetaceae bacterium]
MGSFWCKQTIRMMDHHGSAPIITDKPFALIGSHPQCDLQIDDANVLSVHYYLQATDAGLFCLSLDEERTHHGWLDPNQPMTCGDHQIFASLTAPDDTSDINTLIDLDQPNSLTNTSPMVTLHLNGDELATRHLTAPLTLLGRTHPSVLRIRSDTISRVHCVLYFHAGVLWIVDLLSTNHVCFDERPHAVVALNPGESVAVEPISLTFREFTRNGGKPASPNPSFPTPEIATVRQQVEANVDEELVVAHPATDARPATPASPVTPDAPASPSVSAEASEASANLATTEIVAKLKLRIQELEQQLQQTNDELHAKQALMDETADVLQASREATADWSERISQLEEHVETKSSQLDTQQQQLVQRDTEIQQLEEQLQATHARLLEQNQLVTQIRELEAQLIARTEEVSSAQQSQTQQTGELETLESAQQDLQKKLQTSQQALQLLQQEYDASQAAVRQVRQQLADLEEDYLVQEINYERLEQQYETQLSQLQDQVSQGQELPQKLQSDLQAARKEIDRLKQTEADSIATADGLQQTINTLQTDNRKQFAHAQSRDQKIVAQTKLITVAQAQIASDREQLLSLKEQVQTAAQNQASQLRQQQQQQQRVEQLEKQVSALEDECISEANKAEESNRRLRDADATRNALEQQVSEELLKRRAVAAKLQFATNQVAQLTKTREKTQEAIASLRQKANQLEAERTTQNAQAELRYRELEEQKDARILELETQLAHRAAEIVIETPTSPEEAVDKEHTPEQEPISESSQMEPQAQPTATQQVNKPDSTVETTVEVTQPNLQAPSHELAATAVRPREIGDETQEVRAFAKRRKRGGLPLLYKSLMGVLWLVALTAGGTMTFFFIRAILDATTGE